MALHLLYGEETFLYALHYLPLLIASAALAALGRFRRIALILALIVLCVGGLNNLMKFRQAREIMMHHFYPERGREAPSGVLFTPPNQRLEHQIRQPSQQDILMVLRAPAPVLHRD